MRKSILIVGIVAILAAVVVTSPSGYRFAFAEPEQAEDEESDGSYLEKADPDNAQPGWDLGDKAAVLRVGVWVNTKEGPSIEDAIRKGTALLVIFFRTHLKPDEIGWKSLASLHKKYTRRDFLFCGVADRKEKSVIAHIGDEKPPFPLGADCRSFDAYNIRHIPTAVLVDMNGIIRYRGFVDDSLERALEKLDLETQEAWTARLEPMLTYIKEYRDVEEAAPYVAELTARILAKCRRVAAGEVAREIRAEVRLRGDTLYAEHKNSFLKKETVYAAVKAYERVVKYYFHTSQGERAAARIEEARGSRPYRDYVKAHKKEIEADELLAKARAYFAKGNFPEAKKTASKLTRGKYKGAPAVREAEALLEELGLPGNELARRHVAALKKELAFLWRTYELLTAAERDRFRRETLERIIELARGTAVARGEVRDYRRKAEALLADLPKDD